MKLPFEGWIVPLAVPLVLALGSSGGCAKPAEKADTSRAEPAYEAPSEAAKTRELEDQAAGYRDRFQEIQESDMTAEEKAQAAGELVDEQQRTVREAEDGASGEDPSQQ